MKKGIVALTLSLVIGVGASIYVKASSTTPSTNANNVTCSGIGMGRSTGQTGYNIMSNVLKNKLGLTDKDITDALNSGKTMYNIAKEKGMSEEDFKAAMLEEKSKAIDEAVNKGTITKENGESLKSKIKENISNCTTPGEMKGKKGNGNGHGNGMGMGKHCSFGNSDNIQ